MIKRIIILIVSAIGAISTFLPWITTNATGLGQSFSSSANGTTGDGMATLVLFAIVAIISLIGLKKPLPTWAKITVTILSLLCGGIAGYDIFNASRLGVGTTYSAFGATAGTSIGIGLILIPIMAIINIVVAWLPLDKKNTELGK